MATFDSLDKGFEDLQKRFNSFQKDSNSIERELFYNYDKDIREVTPIDTGRLRRYPHTQANSLKEHTLVWQPKENRKNNIQRGYVGYIYRNSRINFRDSKAITEWDITTAIKNNKSYTKDLSDIIANYFK